MAKTGPMPISSGSTAGDLEAAIDAEDGQAFAFRGGAVHEHLGAGAVGELAGVAGGDVFAFVDPLAVFPDGFEFGEAFGGGVGADAFVAVEGDCFVTDGVAFLVEHGFLHGNGHDFRGKAAGSLAGGGTLLAGGAEFVLGFAADVVALGDDFRGFDHGDVGGRHVLAAPICSGSAGRSW